MLVGDDVVVVGRAHGPGIAEPVGDHRRGAQGEHLGACILGVTVEIDEDVDPVLRDFHCHLVVAETVDLEPLVHRRHGARLRRVGALDAAVVGVNLELRAVVRFQHVRHAEPDGMLAQIG